MSAALALMPTSPDQDAAIEKLAGRHESILVRNPVAGPCVAWGLDDVVACPEHEAIVTRCPRCRVGRSTMYYIATDGAIATVVTNHRGGPLL